MLRTRRLLLNYLTAIAVAVSLPILQPVFAQTLNSPVSGSQSTLAQRTSFANAAGTQSDPVVLPTGNVVNLYSFGSSSTDAIEPDSQLVQASDGNFYGTAVNGGTDGAGAIYKATPSGVVTVVYSFTGGADGGYPNDSPPIQATDGNLYGCTTSGGNGGGTLYSYNIATGQFTTLYAFENGGNPFGVLIDDGKGNLYGTAVLDGDSGNGSVWKWNYATNTFTTLYSFTGGADGKWPRGGVVLATDGNLYGTARFGGNYSAVNTSGQGNGTAFVLSTDGTNFNAFYSFSDGVLQNDGYAPLGDLVEGPDGNLYTTTYSGGDPAVNGGAFIQIIPNGASSKVVALHDFQGVPTEGGGVAYGRPFLGGDRKFYIASAFGGTDNGNGGYGQLMQLDTKGNLVPVYDYYTSEDLFAYGPSAGVTESTDGNLYGTTANGGLYGTSGSGAGALYEVQLGLPPAIMLTPSASAVAPGTAVTLSWAVTNAFSKNDRVCIARSSDGSWKGSVDISGTASVIPTATIGPVTYALTCGGLETAISTITVGGSPVPLTPAVTSTLNPSSIAVNQSPSISATVTGPPGSPLPTGTVQFQSDGSDLGSPVTLSNGTATLSDEVFATAGFFAISASYSGDANYTATESEAVTLAVVPSPVPPAATLTATPATLSISAPGGTGSVTLNVSNFSSNAITFSCAGLPANTTCQFGALSGGTSKLQIVTAGSNASTSLFLPGTRGGSQTMYALALPGLLVIAGLFAKRKRYSQWLNISVSLLLLSLGIVLAGCGGGNSHNTPPGTSTLTVTASAGSQSATTTISLIVQ
jgi:uncharacterized repeat protein (TIGR03803 family)